ncbi:MAG TPA: membrane protein insertase YidC [Cyclobacteriaceae bacterium]|nr:membrane protein insertase YidC [Cyclobacteriaceae bacterium]
MDRNSVIGLSLIAVIFIVYIYFLAPKSTPPSALPQESFPAEVDTIRNQQAAEPVVSDSTLIKQYGTIGAAMTGNVKNTPIENEDVAYTFSSHGNISSVELKKFKTYYQKPLMLAEPDNNQFSLTALVDGRSVDLYKLVYEENISTKADTTVLTYTASIGDGATIRHTYLIPKSGYIIGYRLDSKGVTIADNLEYHWRDNMPAQEKQLDESRTKTTANWYSVGEGFDNISETSLDLENETIAGPVRWAAFRQKFFLSAIMADKTFSSGEFSTIANAADTAHVKDGNMTLFVPSGDVTGATANFKYYFGPNDYDILGKVNAESFHRNVNFGWPPVKWVNQFIIRPIFQFLQSFIGNYGVIIMILVLIIRLLLTPLSYSSYLGMAKMRLLKPELDAIKEKNGDNMAQAQQDQMKLYREAGVNPFAGCIPLLLQLPILLAMFYFFPVSIEFRQEHFLWAEDLSTYDSIMTLPFSIPGYGDHVSLFVLLMTISTLISTWQNNQISSVQGPMKSVSYLMPVIFLFILNSFSAALSFYYFVSNVFGFAQQAIIRRFVNEDKIKVVMESHKKKLASAAPGTGKKSKFMAKLEQAMKASEEAKKKSSRK